MSLDFEKPIIKLEEKLSQIKEIATKSGKNLDKEALSLLWECCQIPDFVKKTYGNHYEVISNVFKFLIKYPNFLNYDFLELFFLVYL